MDEERKAPAPQFDEHRVWLDPAHDVGGGSLQDLNFDIGQVVLDSVRSGLLGVRQKCYCVQLESGITSLRKVMASNSCSPFSS